MVINYARRVMRHARLGKAAATAPLVAGMRSPVNWALLGLVIEHPSHGYELAQRFEQAYDDILPISGMSHIYTALKALRARSLIEEFRTEEVAGGEASRQSVAHYRATARGVSAYRERLVVQKREDDRRSQLFARQLAVFRGEPDVALDVLARYEHACLQESTSSPVVAVNSLLAGEGTELTARLAREASRLTEGARLWLQYARREFRALVVAEAPRQ